MADAITQGILDALANYSQYSGTTAQNMAKGVVDTAKLQQAQDKLALERTGTGVSVGNLNLAQQKQALAAPGALDAASVRGDVLANSQDATFSGLNPMIHIPTMTGGLRPSMLSANSRALGAAQSADALAKQQSGAYTTPAALPTIPSATPLPQASLLQSLLANSGIATGVASTAGGILSALQKAVSGGSSSGGGGSSSGSGGSSGTTTVPGTTGAQGNTPITAGSFDANGNWVPADSTTIAPTVPTTSGQAYDQNGNPIPVGNPWEDPALLQWLNSNQGTGGVDTSGASSDPNAGGT